MEFRLWGVVSPTVFLLTLLAVPAAAQGRNPPQLAASVAAGVANPLHGDLDFNALAWQVAVRGPLSQHVLLEGFFDAWRHTTDLDFPGGLLQGPQGVIGQYGGIAQRTVYFTYTVGLNVLARGEVGRLSITGGGGPGFLSYERTFTQTFSDCQSTVPQACQTFQNRHTSRGFGVQGGVSADVALADRVAVFGQFQLAAPVEDFGSAHVSLMGGLRVALLH
jgi:hypothetical protein